MTQFTQTRVEGGWVRGYPVEGPITSPFGATDIAAHAQGHSGVDIGASSGTPIYAPCAAVVKDVFAIGVGSDEWERVFGNSVILDDGEHVLLFGHMMAPPVVREGQRVEAGDVLGFVGSTGLSTGPHLHFGAAPSANAYLQRALGLIDPLTLIADPPPPPPPDRPVIGRDTRLLPVGEAEATFDYTDKDDERILTTRQRVRIVRE